MIKTPNPFKFSVLLLVMSILASFSFAVKTSSLWVTSVILLTFSSGMMILFSYSSSLSSLETTLNYVDIKFWLLLLTLFLFWGVSSSSYSTEYFLKEFSFGMTMILVLLILVIFMLPMMENCSKPDSPVQASF